MELDLYLIASISEYLISFNRKTTFLFDYVSKFINRVLRNEERLFKNRCFYLKLKYINRCSIFKVKKDKFQCRFNQNYCLSTREFWGIVCQVTLKFIKNHFILVIFTKLQKMTMLSKIFQWCHFWHPNYLHSVCKFSFIKRIIASIH